MALVRKCAKCGLDLTDSSLTVCPVCATKILTQPGPKMWIAALVEIAIMTAILSVMRFPKIMILMFGTFILVGTGLSVWLKPRMSSGPAAPQKPLSHPRLFRVAGFTIAFCWLVCFCVALFGFVIFADAWTRWHRYEGQPYRQSEFQVARVYYQKMSKSYDSYASGRVEGQHEWMSLLPYLKVRPHSQAELEERVPVGTTISIYFFPGMKGRSRVVFRDGPPPAETSRRLAMNTLQHGLTALIVIAGIIFLLSRLRRACLTNSEIVVPQISLSRST